MLKPSKFGAGRLLWLAHHWNTGRVAGELRRLWRASHPSLRPTDVTLRRTFYKHTGLDPSNEIPYQPTAGGYIQKRPDLHHPHCEGKMCQDREPPCKPQVQEWEDTCDKCQTGGQLLCCDQCPKAFHYSKRLNCAGGSLPYKSDASFLCDTCTDKADRKRTPAKYRPKRHGHYCDRCDRAYSTLDGALKAHNVLAHGLLDRVPDELTNTIQNLPPNLTRDQVAGHRRRTSAPALAHLNRGKDRPRGYVATLWLLYVAHRDAHRLNPLKDEMNRLLRLVPWRISPGLDDTTILEHREGTRKRPTVYALTGHTTIRVAFPIWGLETEQTGRIVAAVLTRDEVDFRIQ